jgi:hypothetical protein
MEDTKTKKFPLQICQDEEITKKFRSLHTELVNKVITFCKDNNIVIDEFHLNADELQGSIPYGEWKSCTDSAFSMIKFTDEYNDVVSMKKRVDNDEWKRIKLEQEYYLFSM